MDGKIGTLVSKNEFNLFDEASVFISNDEFVTGIITDMEFEKKLIMYNGEIVEVLFSPVYTLSVKDKGVYKCKQVFDEDSPRLALVQEK